jgi:hypothetical protein
MKLDPGMHIGTHFVSFGKSGVTSYYYSRQHASTQPSRMTHASGKAMLGPPQLSHLGDVTRRI